MVLFFCGPKLANDSSEGHRCEFLGPDRSSEVCLHDDSHADERSFDTILSIRA